MFQNQAETTFIFKICTILTKSHKVKFILVFFCLNATQFSWKYWVSITHKDENRIEKCNVV